MPYLRKVGFQLLILHGSRRAGTRNVSQRTLFAIRSKPEALAIAGEGDRETTRRFQSLMEHAYPMVKFSWPALQAAIKKHAAELPEAFEYRQERLLGRFRTDLVAFARQLAVTDPQFLLSHGDAIRSHRAELEYVRDLINWRLKLCAPRDANQFNTDDQFFWRSTLQGDDLPPETIESFAGVVEELPAEKSLAVGRMLLEAFPGWVDGHQWLGDICAENNLADAERYFLSCLEAGAPRLMRERGKLPWGFDQNRPYIRSLRGLCGVYQRSERYDDVLTTCTRLVKEAGDAQYASAYRAATFLCRGQWMLAADAAAAERELDPTMSFVHAFAMTEQGNLVEASVSATHAVLNHPRAARMLLVQRLKEPRTRSEVDDHNAGVWLHRMIRPYLTSHRQGPALLKRVLREPAVAAALADLGARERKWEAGDRDQVSAMHAARSLKAARKLAGHDMAGANQVQVTPKRRAEA